MFIVGALATYAFLSGVQQSSALSRPKIVITNIQSTYVDDCAAYGSQTSDVTFSATLVNTGGAGYADIGYDIGSQQVTANTYYVGASSELSISDGVTVHTCYGSTAPTYEIVLLQERPA